MLIYNLLLFISLLLVMGSKSNNFGLKLSIIGLFFFVGFRPTYIGNDTLTHIKWVEDFQYLPWAELDASILTRHLGMFLISKVLHLLSLPPRVIIILFSLITYFSVYELIRAINGSVNRVINVLLIVVIFSAESILFQSMNHMRQTLVSLTGLYLIVSPLKSRWKSTLLYSVLCTLHITGVIWIVLAFFLRKKSYRKNRILLTVLILGTLIFSGQNLIYSGVLQEIVTDNQLSYTHYFNTDIAVRLKDYRGIIVESIWLSIFLSIMPRKLSRKEALAVSMFAFFVVLKWVSAEDVFVGRFTESFEVVKLLVIPLMYNRIYSNEIRKSFAFLMLLYLFGLFEYKLISLSSSDLTLGVLNF